MPGGTWGVVVQYDRAHKPVPNRTQKVRVLAEFFPPAIVRDPMKRTQARSKSTTAKRAGPRSDPPNQTRYAALLRGVSPMNLKMAELKAALEAEGFLDVRTVLASGNVVFGVTRRSTEAAIERRLHAAMNKHLGRSFSVFIRSIDALRELLDSSPFEGFRLPAGAKRIVTFLREPPGREVELPVSLAEARILCVRGCEALGAYVPSPGDPAFMRLIEKTFGQDVTTRTWDSVTKIAR